MLTPLEIENRIKTAKPKLANEFNVRRIGYFGSFAKGTYTADSDIDLIVEFGGKIGWKFIDLKDYLEQIFGKPVDLVTERSLKKRVRDQILSQVIYV